MNFYEKLHFFIVSQPLAENSISVREALDVGVWLTRQPTQCNQEHIIVIAVSIISKSSTTPIEIKMSWSSKTANNGKPMRIQEPDCTINRSARRGVETCASDAVLEKSNSAKKETLKVNTSTTSPIRRIKHGHRTLRFLCQKSLH